MTERSRSELPFVLRSDGVLRGLQKEQSGLLKISSLCSQRKRSIEPMTSSFLEFAVERICIESISFCETMFDIALVLIHLQ